MATSGGAKRSDESDRDELSAALPPRAGATGKVLVVAVSPETALAAASLVRASCSPAQELCFGVSIMNHHDFTRCESSSVAAPGALRFITSTAMLAAISSA